MIAGAGELLLLGCGKMGGALLRGWLAEGLPADRVTVMDPRPPEWLIELTGQGLCLNALPQTPPDIAVIATKPQIMAQALPDMAEYGNGPTLFLSIAAGTPISVFETMLGANTPVVRAMPNTPAAVGAGITALVANAQVAAGQLAQVQALMGAVGDTVLLEDEDQMHAVTGLSGSGPGLCFRHGRGDDCSRP
ncbi:pyrroline-5-carboxylate reductase family protein [Aliiroseovarius sp.]|uniref:pyrroline-5-carboxylate reductase family protein n=1 Tax=Aliiroseovarius sp. TaxID=1872442 RepID=UPI003BADADEC